ncbi:MAG: hypothetical protein BWZ07_02334 [Alphaproteobacteria bacterium ADurb.BinA280]|nr:MAG: hypothetical protein BWZ07_02334 [Alphaproteobacteria bacterium ADurb.BinA280]
MNDHLDVVAVATERFVNGVVEHLEHHVMQAGAITGVTDVHAGALADGLQTFQDADRIFVVFSGLFIGIGHETFSAFGFRFQ